jgi:hypothetical protein
MTVKDECPPSNAQVSAWRALWERLLVREGAEVSQQKQSLEKTDLNVTDGASEPSSTLKERSHDAG